jgi:hypothetical protein
MKRACPSLVESSGSTGSARSFQFYLPWCFFIDILFVKSMSNILITTLSGKIHAGVGVRLAQYDFRRARGILRFTLAM